eukprot:CAMPEP_0174259562 /NCGR_PEP_ID=MMETSP0439-20130205/8370_1 /TAXON_ID=0 /ORGANISM="Stereomyxa ramosa, Strain Chinc5" /LENGTH=818 /DNA_ID=CAMNT_0015343499 /DNA_START=269 /DNA_END=2722 /DNA_ORIENTATION=-
MGEETHMCQNNDTNATDCSRDADSLSRFVDNEELRYSLRSVEKFAPWARKIYIVTNGQIPYWLDLSHPRIEIITHEMIFPNKSHLPTFSSPAIECHLHRIPGLSNKFLYLNDDTMFGLPIWPSDFYDEPNGQRIYLAWNVPDCNDGCPASWIHDGYCDQACNVEACRFDGGDCANTTASSGSGASGGSWAAKDTATKNCQKGCPDTWVGDKYCDRPCNNPLCAMDGGDCGIDSIYTELYGQNVSYDSSAVELPSNVPAAYLGLSTLLHSFDSISSAAHNSKEVVRTATFTLKAKVMTFTFHPNVPREIFSVSITGKSGADSISFKLNISAGLIPEPEEPDEDELLPGDDIEIISEADDAGGEETERVELGSDDWDSWENDDSGPDDTEGNNLRQLLEYKIPISVAERKRNELEIRARDKKKAGLQEARAKELQARSERIQKAIMASGEYAYPWEIMETANQRTTTNKRGLLDAFGDSLRHVNALLDLEFGPAARKVIAHMPHFIQTDIVEKMQSLWKEQFEATSSHQFRHPKDMQFAFSHMYYIMSERKENNMMEIWDEDLDRDHSGYLDNNELRTLAAKIYGAPVNPDQFKEMKKMLKDGACATGQYTPPTAAPEPEPIPESEDNPETVSENQMSSQPDLDNESGPEDDSEDNNNDQELEDTYDEDKVPQESPVIEEPPEEQLTIWYDELVGCAEIMERVHMYYVDVKKNKFKIESTDADVAFMMVNTNINTTRDRLDGLRKKPYKFICLNDDIDHTDPKSKKTLKIIRDFYDSMFPLPSSFELPPGQKNAHLYYKDYHESTVSTFRKKFGIALVIW